MNPAAPDAAEQARPEAPGAPAGLLGRVVGGLHRLAAFVFLPLLATVVTVDVLGRYFFSAPLDWGQDVCTVLLLLLFMAAMPACTVRHEHVRIETLYEMVGPRLRRGADCISHVAGILVMAVLAYSQLSEILPMYEREEELEMIAIPLWPVALAVGVSALVVGLVLASRLARLLVRSSSHEPRP